MNKEDFIKALDIREDEDGNAYIAGDVHGDVRGYVGGDVVGSVVGDVGGDVSYRYPVVIGLAVETGP